MADWLIGLGSPLGLFVNASTTRQFPIVGGVEFPLAGETRHQITARRSYTVSRLKINIKSNATAAASTLTFRINGANGNQIITIPAGITGALEDAVNTDAVVNGNAINSQLITGAGGGVEIATINYNVNADAVEPIVGAARDGNVITGNGTDHHNIVGELSTTASAESFAQWLSSTAATFRNFQMQVSLNTLSVAMTTAFRINGVDGTLSITIPAGMTGCFEDAVNSDAFVATDLLNFRTTTPASAGSAEFDTFSVRMIGGDRIQGMGNMIPAQQNAGVSNFFPIECGHAGSSTVESEMRIASGIQFIAKNYLVKIQNNTLNGASTISLRVNGVSSLLSVTIPAMTTGNFENLVDEVTVEVADLINHLSVAGGAAGNFTHHYITFLMGQPPGVAPVITSVTPVSGSIAGGNEVTIFGTDLGGATSVTFGGTEVTSIDENSATRIAVTVAAHALGLVNVVVTTPGGSDTEVNAYDFLDPVITSIVPDAGPSSGGTSVTITGTDLDDATAVTFGGVAATDLFAGGSQGDDLDTHTSDTGETWAKVSAGGQIFINIAFGPIAPNARTSGVTVLTEYLWSAQGKDGVLECFVKNTTGGSQSNTGLFFRRNAGTEDRWIATLETASGASDSVLRLQSLGGGGVNTTVTVIGKTQGTLRVEFSGPEIKVYFDNILKISVSNAFVQNDVGLGLHKPIDGGGALEEWDTLSFVDGGEITSNSTTQIVVTTPAGPVGLVDVEVTNPGGVTTEVDGYTYLGGGGTAGLIAAQKEFLL